MILEHVNEISVNIYLYNYHFLEHDLINSGFMKLKYITDVSVNK